MENEEVTIVRMLTVSIAIATLAACSKTSSPPPPSGTSQQISQPTALTPQQKSEAIEKLCFDFGLHEEQLLPKHSYDKMYVTELMRPEFKELVRACSKYQTEVGEAQLTTILDRNFGRPGPATSGSIRNSLAEHIKHYPIRGEEVFSRPGPCLLCNREKDPKTDHWSFCNECWDKEQKTRSSK